MTQDELNTWISTFSDSLSKEVESISDDIDLNLTPSIFELVHCELKAAFLSHLQGEGNLSTSFLQNQYQACLKSASFSDFFKHYLRVSLSLNTDMNDTSKHPLADFFSERMQAESRDSLDGKTSSMIPVWSKKIAFNLLLKMSLETAILEFLSHTKDFEFIFADDKLNNTFRTQVSPKLAPLTRILAPYTQITLADGLQTLDLAKANEGKGLYFSQLLIFGAAGLVLVLGPGLLRNQRILAQLSTEQLFSVTLIGILAITAIFGVFTGIYYLSQFIASKADISSRERNTISLTDFQTPNAIEFDQKIANAINQHPKTANGFLAMINNKAKPGPSQPPKSKSQKLA
ncbi:MAG: hypothetical protein ACHP9Y_00575 [Gammaproteobacteria bacterium]